MYRLAAEFAPQRAIFIAWPLLDQETKSAFIGHSWTFIEILRNLAKFQQVHVLCDSEETQQQIEYSLKIFKINQANICPHIVNYKHWWIRDTGPTAVYNSQNELNWIIWDFNGWGKHPGVSRDPEVPWSIANITSADSKQAYTTDSSTKLVFEGGIFDTDGQGTLIVSEECLLSSDQSRNNGLAKDDYETCFRKYLAIGHTIWLPFGIVGDMTHGHIDQVARFSKAGQILVAYTEDSADSNFERFNENIACLEQCTDASGKKLEIIKIHLPEAIYFENEQLPASYLNFIITNKSVLVPTFNDPKDILALNQFEKIFKERQIIPIYARDLLLGGGGLHCLTLHVPK